MIKKIKKTLKMGQKIEKMSPIIKKSCYFTNPIPQYTGNNNTIAKTSILKKYRIISTNRNVWKSPQILGQFNTALIP